MSTETTQMHQMKVLVCGHGYPLVNGKHWETAANARARQHAKSACSADDGLNLAQVMENVQNASATNAKCRPNTKKNT